MRHVVKSVIFSITLAGLAALAFAPLARAAVHDGVWSVEKGACDRGYRYEVKVINGHISYNGDSGINLAGTVSSDGATRVSISAGDKGATGTGYLSARTGSGIWHGIGASGNCAGRWEAELR
jgi:hypothetical protein